MTQGGTIELLRGSVQNWECDIMGHMNVRHYVARAEAALGALAVALGRGPSVLRARGERLRVFDQHVRFAREMPAGVPFTIRGGVVHAGPTGLRAYLEFRNEAADAVAATFVQDVRLEPGAGDLWSDPARASVVEVPDHAAPRGLAWDPPAEPLSRARAEALGLSRIHLGAVTAEDCDPHGFMRNEGFIARVWDGLPHLTRIRPRDPQGRGLGGAALEYRLVYREAARQGDIVEILSGLRAVGGKTTEWCHFLYNVETGAHLGAAAAVGVAFDLETRRAVAPDEATLRLLREQVVPGLAV